MKCEACQTELTTDTCPLCGLKQKKVMCKDCMKKFYKEFLNQGLCPECLDKEKNTSHKEPLVALALSILPGGGQYYLGQRMKSGVYLCMFSLCGIIPVIGWIMLPVAWIVPAVDAYNTAKRINVLNEA